MDLSKTIETLNHNLLVAKLKAYGIDSNGASFMKRYRTSRYQRSEIGDSFSEWERAITVIPQGYPWTLTF